ncbi:tektin-B1-like isoform X1 [Leptidea sinapis]|uniref:tektin-B1-like isoform X1 n=1 Tax=Leptidea sinapis TaxID=189913 RepID=UPI0021C44458|nr:tektin-B1-like isoform X1 [Leptidea sinapis]
MFNQDVCLGHSCDLDKIRAVNDKLNAEVVEQINGSQELVMLTNFARESNEYVYKKCLQERISDINSWRWVLEDLCKRLEEALVALRHEEKALRVVVERIQDEIENYSKQGSRPGVINPLNDAVEESIKQEFMFLRNQKRRFVNLALELDTQITLLEKTKNRIERDILSKEEAVNVDVYCADKDYSDAVVENWKKKRKQGLPMKKWEKRCETLKKAGLRALRSSIVTRQQVRGARAHLSFEAQAMAIRVDTLLRRRLHTNILKLDDLKWQREEALRDRRALEEEKLSAEKNLLNVLDQQRIVAARIVDRTNRPGIELIKDDVDRKLRGELVQIRQFEKEHQVNLKRIESLENAIADAIVKIDCSIVDLTYVINLDKERIRVRSGGEPRVDPKGQDRAESASASFPTELTVIREEEEEDDYPFDY